MPTDAHTGGPATTTVQSSYCRVCQASCGVLVTVADGRVLDVRGDPDNPMSRGYLCSKGSESPAIHHGEARLRRSLVRAADGSFQPVDVNDAIAGIADRVQRIVQEDGPDAVALFLGTFALFGALTSPLARGWLRALGSASLYTTGTIDQSAKWIVPLRMGRWEGGWQRFEDSDVWLLSGTNPLVSMQGGGTLTGFPAWDPVHRLKEARARGLRLIVIDPRRTETARQADLHLQPRPGHDATIFACLVHVVLERGWIDREFCERYVEDLDALREAVARFTPERTAAVAGLEPDELIEAARVFATARRGMAHGGTGPDMGPHSNLAEHLICTLNVICGRYARAGDPVAHPGALGARTNRRACVAPPDRHWERGPTTGVGRYGALWGERPTTALPDEILHGGAGRVRALIVVGGNPVACWPDQERTLRALDALDLLVVIDPRMTETARRAHYVIAPTLPFERPDHTAWYEALWPAPYAQYTPALIPAPPDTIDDWRFFTRLARRAGLTVQCRGRRIEPGQPEPDADELLRELVAADGADYDELLAAPHGRIFEQREQVVEAAPGADGRFRLLPADVAAELAALPAESSDEGPYPLRLVCRRSRWTMNSFDGEWPSARSKLGGGIAWVHPDDLAAHGLDDGGRAFIESRTGSVVATVRGDATLRPGVVSMPHCQAGASTGRLVDSSRRQQINGMPIMSSIAVRLRAANAAGADPRNELQGP
jgi:anaerobic selenocysteine-containing dehydrogenase